MRMRSIALLLILASTLVIRTKAQPELQVVQGVKFDFGKIYRGEVVERGLTLRNSGTESLTLGKVDVSCGCTGTMVSKDHIAPGDSATLLIKFNSRNFTGPIHKTVIVNSNAKGEPKTAIEFTGDVVDEVLMTPEQFWFKEAEVGRTDSLTISVTNNGPTDLMLKGFKTKLEGFTLMLPADPLKPGEKAVITAVFTPKSEIRVLAEQVILETSDPHAPEITIPVYGVVNAFKFQ